jgi:hypothetical protein
VAKDFGINIKLRGKKQVSALIFPWDSNELFSKPDFKGVKN